MILIPRFYPRIEKGSREIKGAILELMSYDVSAPLHPFPILG